MIFVTVGTHDQQFDRLLSEMDLLSPQLDEEVVAQTGHSSYHPSNMEWFDFVSEAKVNDYYENASVIVGHAGAGTILTALSYEKPLVLVPRRKEHGEHLDDHQLELTGALQNQDGVFVVESSDNLATAIDSALGYTGSVDARPTGGLVQYFADEIDGMVN